MNFEERINRLEQAFGYVHGRVPGTILSRNLGENSIGWSLSLGLMQSVKEVFTALTIAECLEKAEKWVEDSKPLRERMNEPDTGRWFRVPSIGRRKIVVDNEKFATLDGRGRIRSKWYTNKSDLITECKLVGWRYES